MRKIQFIGYGVELPKNTVNFKEQIRYRISGEEKQISLAVTACQKALKNAFDAGFSIIMEGGGFGLDNDGHFAYLDTEDVCGITYELIQRPLRRHEPEAIFPSA